MLWVKIVQIIISVLLILSILLQNKGASLGGVFGGSNNVYLSKRGFDKFLFVSSIVFACLFLGVSLFGLLY